MSCGKTKRAVLFLGDFVDISHQEPERMKKFKQTFYPIYLIVIVLVLVIAFNIYEALELFKTWGWFRYFSDLPYMGRDLMVFLCLLMGVELIAENFHLANLRAKNGELEQKVIDLKAKLYDKSQGEEIEPEEEEEPEEEDESDT
ncbi:MAG: hypothetical protein ACI8QD_000010 [Cyclobacteriaceae bacterium]|jgi:hypothetical protein